MFLDACVLLHNQLQAAVVDHVGYEAGIISSHPTSGARMCLMMYLDGIKHTIHIISYMVCCFFLGQNDIDSLPNWTGLVEFLWASRL